MNYDDRYIFIYIFNLQVFVFTVCKHKYTLYIYIYIFSIHDIWSTVLLLPSKSPAWGRRGAYLERSGASYDAFVSPGPCEMGMVVSDPDGWWFRGW